MPVPVEQPGKCLIENIFKHDNKLAKRENISSYITIFDVCHYPLLYALRCVRGQVQIQSTD